MDGRRSDSIKTPSVHSPEALSHARAETDASGQKFFFKDPIMKNADSDAVFPFFPLSDLDMEKTFLSRINGNISSSHAG